MLFILCILVAAGAIIAARMTEANRQVSTVVAVAAVLLGFVQVFRVVPAGNVGVVDFFGKVSDKTLKAGINMVNPLSRVINFSVKTEELKETMNVPSKEGLTVTLEMSVLYHLDPEKAADVYKTIGPNYLEVILEPQIRSVARGVTSSYDARALYTAEREVLAKAVLGEIKALVEPRGIFVESTPLRQVGLPQRVTDAIEEKLKAEQESQRMQFVLMKERQEAERKGIEAKGISDFQTIVAKGISDQLLRWKGIEATEKLANSSNTKIIIVGGKDGLPLILNSN
jgi:prohibitin 1